MPINKFNHCESKRPFKSMKAVQNFLNKAKKGGISGKNRCIRYSNKMDNWREKVFKGDNYTCQKCKQYGGKLEAHHKKSWNKYPKLRYVVSNGMTLCYKCHHKKGQ